MNLVEVFKQGGFIMYPLLIFSVALWTVAIQKIWFIINFKKQSKYFFEEGMRIVKSKRFNEMEWLYKNCPEIIAKPHSAIFEDTNSQEEWDARMQRRLNETTQGLKKNLWVLGTIGSSAPFVGLFGTVWGIMGSFKAIGAAGKSGFAVVASTISEALVATAAGILVAVFAVMFYNYLQVKVTEALNEFKNGLGDLTESFNSAKK
ncbi:MAG: MotA/TolQ/ExbB proton channel family protein [Bacteriovorax sp.]|nr:MotA/TolQ/ExbB proton channel family protein [Bacteriovorax sp.]